MKNVGFIGLGAMGHWMAHHLVRSGLTVRVFDLNQVAVEQLVAEGALACNSYVEMAEKSDVIFTSVQTGVQVNEICLSDEGIFSHAKPGTYFIDCSSIDIATTKFLHDQARQLKLHMLDAPVSGGVAAAQAASLTMMVGGETSDYEKMLPILSIIAKKIIHAGDASMGQAAKICNNMLLAISMIGVSEAFTLAKKLGLDQKTFFDISSNASGQCWSMTSYCPVPNIIENVPANREYQPGFRANMMLKDLHLALNAAALVDGDIPLGKKSCELYEKFSESGNGELDFSAIIRMLEK